MKRVSLAMVPEVSGRFVAMVVLRPNSVHLYPVWVGSHPKRWSILTRINIHIHLFAYEKSVESSE